MRTAKIRNKMKGDWKEKNNVNDQSLNRIMSLN